MKLSDNVESAHPRSCRSHIVPTEGQSLNLQSNQLFWNEGLSVECQKSLAVMPWKSVVTLCEFKRNLTRDLIAEQFSFL